MKILILTIAGLCALLPSCSSVAGLGMGSDSAAINASRGRSDAVMSRAQARQYSRQRRQTSEEIDLERKKTHYYRENLGLLRDAGRLFR